jgi:hypothetical protein
MTANLLAMPVPYPEFMPASFGPLTVVLEFTLARIAISSPSPFLNAALACPTVRIA